MRGNLLSILKTSKSDPEHGSDQQSLRVCQDAFRRNLGMGRRLPQGVVSHGPHRRDSKPTTTQSPTTMGVHVKSFAERNASAGARWKLKKLARTTGLSPTLVHTLVSSVWDFDEANRLWVEDRRSPGEAAVAEAEAFLDLERGFGLEGPELVSGIRASLESTERIQAFQAGFIEAVANGNMWGASPYATAMALSGLNEINAHQCDGFTSLGFEDALRLLGLKLVRGGSLEHVLSLIHI